MSGFALNTLILVDPAGAVHPLIRGSQPVKPGLMRGADFDHRRTSVDPICPALTRRHWPII